MIKTSHKLRISVDPVLRYFTVLNVLLFHGIINSFLRWEMGTIFIHLAAQHFCSKSSCCVCSHPYCNGASTGDGDVIPYLRPCCMTIYTEKPVHWFVQAVSKTAWWWIPFHSPFAGKKTIYRNGLRPAQPDHNSKAAKNCIIAVSSCGFVGAV